RPRALRARPRRRAGASRWRAVRAAPPESCRDSLQRMAGDEAPGPPEGVDQDWAPPAELDGFRVVRQLGQGGMGTVYLGHADLLERPVALKFLASGDPTMPARERFRIEARAIARLQHPNVVQIYRVGEVHGRPYLAYELINGQSLDKLPKPLA